METKSFETPINIIKKGNNYMQISFGHIQLRDVLNYTTPCNLSTYLSQWQISEKKSIFPFSLFQSVKDMKKCVTFPSKLEFWSELKQETVDQNTYELAKKEFERCQKLPNTDVGHVSNMFDWLRVYNLLDVKPLTEAIETANDKFNEFFKVDPLISMSLPSLAFE